MASPASSATIRPRRMTSTRWERPRISSSSDEIRMTPSPSAARLGDEVVDRALRADVDAARRLVRDHHARARTAACGRAVPSAGCRPRARARARSTARRGRRSDRARCARSSARARGARRRMRSRRRAARASRSRPPSARRSARRPCATRGSSRGRPRGCGAGCGRAPRPVSSTAVPDCTRAAP